MHCNLLIEITCQHIESLTACFWELLKVFDLPPLVFPIKDDMLITVENLVCIYVGGNEVRRCLGIPEVD